MLSGVDDVGTVVATGVGVVVDEVSVGWVLRMAEMLIFGFQSLAAQKNYRGPRFESSL